MRPQFLAYVAIDKPTEDGQLFQEGGEGGRFMAIPRGEQVPSLVQGNHTEGPSGHEDTQDVFDERRQPRKI